MNHLAVTVTEHLHLNVSGLLYESLRQQAPIAKVAKTFSARRGNAKAAVAASREPLSLLKRKYEIGTEAPSMK